MYLIVTDICKPCVYIRVDSIYSCAMSLTQMDLYSFNWGQNLSQIILLKCLETSSHTVYFYFTKNNVVLCSSFKSKVVGCNSSYINGIAITYSRSEFIPVNLYSFSLSPLGRGRGKKNVTDICHIA